MLDFRAIFFVLMLFGAGVFVICSEWDTQALVEQEVSIRRGQLGRILQQRDKTSFFFEDDDSTVFETTSITNSYLQREPLNMAEKGSKLEVWYRDNPSWREVVQVKVGNILVLSIDDFNDGYLSNRFYAFCIGGGLIALAGVLLFVFINQEKLFKNRGEKVLSQLKLLPEFDEGILTLGEHELFINHSCRFEKSRYGHLNQLEVLLPVDNLDPKIQWKVFAKFEIATVDGEKYVQFLYSLDFGLKPEKFIEWSYEQVREYEEFIAQYENLKESLNTKRP